MLLWMRRMDNGPRDCAINNDGWATHQTLIESPLIGRPNTLRGRVYRASTNSWKTRRENDDEPRPFFGQHRDHDPFHLRPSSSRDGDRHRRRRTTNSPKWECSVHRDLAKTLPPVGPVASCKYRTHYCRELMPAPCRCYKWSMMLMMMMIGCRSSWLVLVLLLLLLLLANGRRVKCSTVDDCGCGGVVVRRKKMDHH